MALNNEKDEVVKQGKALNTKLSRRGFLKTSLGVGIGATGAALFGSDVMASNNTVNAAETVVHDTMPIEISPNYRRYDQGNQVIMRALKGDPAVKESFQNYYGKKNGLIPMNEGEGYGRLEEAINKGAWSVEDGFNGYHAPGFANQGLYSWNSGKINPNVYKFDSPEDASKVVKRAAKFYGASMVGIAPYDERWVFSRVFDKKKLESVPNDLPFEPKNVIVMALEMDYIGIQAAPTYLELAATGNIYSNISVVVNKLSHFIRNLGYQTIPCGNDTALSVPLAIHAGLGELSRIGILITPEYGPRVRLCKIFTDLPLAVDKPITFGVTEFCTTCMKCADSCPSGAISTAKEPSFQDFGISSNGGVKRWAADGEKCLKQWGVTGTDCGICIHVCPYNKTSEWHHDLSKLATRTPARPVLRFFDDLFGYGKTSVPDAMKKFWDQ